MRLGVDQLTIDLCRGARELIGGKVASYESSSDQVISLQVQAIRVVKKYLFKLQNDPLSSGQTAQTKQPFRSSFVDSF